MFLALLFSCTAITATQGALIVKDSHFRKDNSKTEKLSTVEEKPKEVRFIIQTPTISEYGLEFGIKETDYCNNKVTYRDHLYSVDDAEDSMAGIILGDSPIYVQIPVTMAFEATVFGLSYAISSSTVGADVNTTLSDWKRHQNTYIYTGLGLAALTSASIGYFVTSKKKTNERLANEPSNCHLVRDTKNKVGIKVTVNDVALASTFDKNRSKAVVDQKSLGEHALEQHLQQGKSFEKGVGKSVFKISLKRTGTNGALPGSLSYKERKDQVGTIPSDIQLFNVDNEALNQYKPIWMCSVLDDSIGKKLLNSAQPSKVDRSLLFLSTTCPDKTKRKVQSLCSAMPDYFKKLFGNSERQILNQGEEFDVYLKRCEGHDFISSQITAHFNTLLSQEDELSSTALLKVYNDYLSDKQRSKASSQLDGLKTKLKKDRQKAFTTKLNREYSLWGKNKPFDFKAIEYFEQLIIEGVEHFSDKWKTKEYNKLAKKYKSYVNTLVKNNEFYTARRAIKKGTSKFGESWAASIEKSISKQEAAYERKQAKIRQAERKRSQARAKKQAACKNNKMRPCIRRCKLKYFGYALSRDVCMQNCCKKCGVEWNSCF